MTGMIMLSVPQHGDIDMAFDPISAVFSVGEKLIDRLWPDPAQKAAGLLELKKLQQSGDLAFLDADVKLMTGQMEINKAEAMHGGNFKGGWRPFIGWTCGLALAYKFLILPFIIAGVQIIAFYAGESPFPIDLLPELSWQELSVPLLGMLGLGTQRSLEKIKTNQ
ncbi:MAG: holin family protein [Candidatus Puniceispirillaceae bacterium]